MGDSCRALLALVLALLAVCNAAASNYTNCNPMPLITPFMEVLWEQNPDPNIINQPVSPILRGPNQTPQQGYSTKYGSNCPASGPIGFLYWTETPSSPTELPGGDFQFNKSVLIPSSNYTLAPFTNPLIPVEQLQLPLMQPTLPETCDDQGRCIEAYEITVDEVTLDMGFRDPVDGTPLLSQFLAYNGQVPGPRIEVKQGVQTFIRLRNNLYCNTTTWEPENNTCNYYNIVDSVTLHNHGAHALSPFDGWAPDQIPSCKWKDYVFPNDRGVAADEYHDHALGLTSVTVGSGLFGSYWVKPCDLSVIPKNLLAIQPDGNPQQLLMYDLIYWQLPGSQYMNPYMANTLSAFNSTPAPLIAAVAADHIYVNGKHWPQVSVQRRPYWFLLHNSAQTRTFALQLRNAATSAVLPIWFVGAEGGLRSTPYLQHDMFLMGAGEKYHIVIDFSSASPGDEFILNNLPTLEANFAQYCYTNMVIKFVVDGTDPPKAPFDYNYKIVREEQADIDAACAAAEERGADVQMVAGLTINVPGTEELGAAWAFLSVNFSSSKPTPGQWAVALMPPNNYTTYSDVYLPEPESFQMRRRRSSRAMLRASPAATDATVVRRRQLQAEASTQFLLSGLPFSVAQNSWVSWSVANAGGGTHPHPIHLHAVEFYHCNTTTKFQKNFGLDVPRDSFFLDSGEVVTVVARFGPHQGTFQFHCHNLFHEDAGLMGEFNISSFNKPPQKTTFPNGTVGSRDQYGMGRGAADKYAVNYPYTDPLVVSVPEYPFVGHNMYLPYSMPYWAYRTDPKHPGRPQPLTKHLLKKVLRRNYYAVYYPKGRDSLAQPVENNKWAVVCPAHTAHIVE